MFQLSQNVKEACAKYVGPDGKLIIDDSLSEEVKEAFRYFNSQNIDIMNFSIPDPDNSDDGEGNYEKFDTENLYNDEENNLDFSSSEIEDDGTEDISNLENLF